MKKHVPILSLAFILLHLLSPAQNWQWAMRGGGAQDGANSNSREELTNITTDNHGNVYALSRVVYSPVIMVGSQQITLPSNMDATALFSYTCDGTFRWGKVLQVHNVSGLATDTLGGLYLSGNIGSGEFFVGNFNDNDADTTWPIYSGDMKMLVLTKFDTLGNFQWVRQPQPDTITVFSPQPWSVDMDVEKDGTIHWMNVLFPANYAGTGLIVTSPGCHMLRYDRNGNFTGSTPVAINYGTFSYVPTGFYQDHFRYSKNNNRYIVSGDYYPGDPTLTINGTNINQPLYVASFDAATGSAYWVHQASGPWCSVAYGPAVDDQNNIYVAGTLATGYSFNGFTQNNTFTSITQSIPFIQKMDANGNALWTHGSNASSGMSPGCLALSDSLVATTLGYAGRFQWDNSSQILNSPYAVYGINVYLTRFNRFTGSCIHTDTLFGTNPVLFEEYGLSIGADRDANFYVGGRMQDNIVVNGNYIFSSGGDYDFFLAKFGNAICGPQSPVGLKTSADEQSVTVYPNPAASYVTVDHLPLNAELTLTDALGRKLQTMMCMDEKQTLSIAHLKAGIYFLEVKQGTTRTTRKIVIE